MVVWSGLDAAISDDGDGSLVGLEKVWLGDGVGGLWNSASSECSLDSDLFWGATTGLGAGEYHRDVGGDSSDDDRVFPCEESGGVVDGAVFRVGEFCDGVELHVVAIELGRFFKHGMHGEHGEIQCGTHDKQLHFIGMLSFMESFPIPCIPCILWFLPLSHIFLLIAG